ncbi:MAG: hypothetical protein E6R13_09670 [Spirochaetes bacterium]|nr:MAG: hypothetical protein E6R13_09670 [Spirochaetota bacterium]
MNIEDFEIVGENSTHYLSRCPECSKNKSPKLYIDKRDGGFICFRHPEFKGYLDGYEFSHLLQVDKVDVNEDVNKIYNLSGLKKVSDYNESPQFKYLIGRGFDLEYIERSQIRIFKMFNRDCIIIPNKVEDEKTNLIQVRFIDKGDFRWFNVPNLKKHISAMQFIKGEKKLVICEGFFTSASVSQVKGYDSIAILGKFLTPLQGTELVELIKENNYEEVIVALDENTYKETIDLSKSIKNLVYPLPITISKILITGENGRDFNDFTLNEKLYWLDKRDSSYGVEKFINKLFINP